MTPSTSVVDATLGVAAAPGRTRSGPRRGQRFAVVLAAGLAGVLAGCGGTATPGNEGASVTSSGSGSASASAAGSESGPGSSSGSGTASGSGSASPSASSSTSADVRTLRVTVTGKRVSPPPARVDLAQGERLRLVITVDHDDAVHVHGFEVEREITAGRPVTIDLTGGEPGLYEVETHSPELRLLQVLVR